MTTLAGVIGILINVLFVIVLIHLVMGLLIQFDVLNRRQPVVMNIYYGIGQLLDPVLAPIRRILPPTGGLDFSPLVLLVALQILQYVIANNV